MRVYSDPTRESDAYSLPDVEIFHMSAGDFESADEGSWMREYLDDENEPAALAGFYYWFCFPGCLPEGDPIGPFRTEEQALSAMRDDCSD